MSKEFDKLQDAVKIQLKKDNPNMEDSTLESKSFEIATSQFKKLESKESVDDKFDDDGRYIVSENTKLYINADISVVEE